MVAEEVVETILPSSILKLCFMLIIGVVVIAGVSGAVVSRGSGYTVTLSMTNNPSDGDKVTFDEHVFEFDSGNGVAQGHIPVSIGTTVVESKSHLMTALQSYYSVTDTSDPAVR